MLRCDYCGGTTYAGPASGDAMDAPGLGAPGSSSLHARLLHGPTGESLGHGQRFDVGAMTARDVPAFERGLWPTMATASSTFGGSWSPSVLVGPPRVYPRSGDIMGAWAPGPRSSSVEWIEVRFGANVPSSTIRVFETNCAGSTFAVVDTTEGEELLFSAPPTMLPGAQVLEIALAPERVVRSLRVYLVNPAWCEVDTVGLLAESPLPENLRTRVVTPALGSAGSKVGCLVGLALLGVGAAVVAGLVLGRSSSNGASSAPPPRPALVAQGTTIAATRPPVEDFTNEAVVWADTLGEFSSEYASETNGARQVLGPPDVYPGSGDLPAAWASLAQDAGFETITVRWTIGVDARALVWVETLNPGAVVRVDDVSEPARPVILFEGTEPTTGAASSVVRLGFPSRRSIRAVRLVLDTRKVAGWNELDAVGLVP